MKPFFCFTHTQSLSLSLSLSQGKYDLPAFISFILSKTGASQLTYVGHSMGTAAMWIMTDYYPDFAAEKLNLVVAMAPVETISNMVSPIRHLIPFNNEIEVAQNAADE